MPDAAEPGVMPGFENRLLSGSGVVLRTLFPLGATLAIATISFAALRSSALRSSAAFFAAIHSTHALPPPPI